MGRVCVNDLSEDLHNIPFWDSVKMQSIHYHLKYYLFQGCLGLMREEDIFCRHCSWRYLFVISVVENDRNLSTSPTLTSFNRQIILPLIRLSDQGILSNCRKFMRAITPFISFFFFKGFYECIERRITAHSLRICCGGTSK